ncbi:DUF397 domain-containing protein [Streptomyces sp. NPDC008150]|uniref:DUF397 domain-containing protein n=1 Tax=Streptomyces sp. NPDC008150 TaxID=3364816 RepID=UPI0036E6FE23
MSSVRRWIRSSYSDSSGGNCLEAAHDWLRSSYSNDSGGNCLEAAADHPVVHLRDSKAPDRATVTVSATAWTAFLNHSFNLLS